MQRTVVVGVSHVATPLHLRKVLESALVVVLVITDLEDLRVV